MPPSGREFSFFIASSRFVRYLGSFLVSRLCSFFQLEKFNLISVRNHETLEKQFHDLGQDTNSCQYKKFVLKHLAANKRAWVIFF